MNYINDIFLGIIFILFPIISYLVYVAYNKNIEKDENKLVFCFALFSSMYLMLGEAKLYYPRIGLYMVDIVIIIAYLKNHYTTALIFSLFCTLFFMNISNVYLLLIKYILYFILFMVKEKNHINTYLYIFICLTLQLIIYMIGDDSMFSDNIIATYLLSLLSAFIVRTIVIKVDSILKYHLAYKELVQEKQVRSYLFKITHEIKNPLAVCKGYFQMLDIDNNEQCKKYIPIIKSEVNHALLILNDFSNLSKIKINKDLIDINLLVNETISNLQELLNEKGIKLVYKDDDEEIYLNGDYNRLMQVLINVIKNSIEALTYSNKKQIEIELMDKNDKVELTVKDNGCGMSEETLKEFDMPFFTTKKDGTGLGTVLSKEIVLAHEGTIDYRSNLNEGTTVIIKLPKKATS